MNLDEREINKSTKVDVIDHGFLTVIKEVNDKAQPEW